jgi:hypothetical protein
MGRGGATQWTGIYWVIIYPDNCFDDDFSLDYFIIGIIKSRLLNYLLD